MSVSRVLLLLYTDIKCTHALHAHTLSALTAQLSSFPRAFVKALPKHWIKLSSQLSLSRSLTLTRCPSLSLSMSICSYVLHYSVKQFCVALFSVRVR